MRIWHIPYDQIQELPYELVEAMVDQLDAMREAG
jgi:hypothetical protein